MKKLFAESFFEDPAIKASVEAMISTLKKHQDGIKGVREGDKEREVSYNECLNEFKKVRGNGLYFPYVASGIGNGPFVELLDGSVKLDFITGIGVHHFGHSHLELVKTAVIASLYDTVMQGNLQQSGHSLSFSKKLLELANRKGGMLKHCFLSGSGVMAGENALKIAFQKNHPADRVLAFENCFAGRTLAFSQITDKPAYRVGLPSVMKTDYIPFFDHYNPEKSVKKSVEALKRVIARYPKAHAAMFFEFIQGEGGFYPGAHDFFRQLMEVCRAHGIAVIGDEVQTFARTTEPFAYQYFNLQDLIDIVCVGKCTQVCATLFREEYNPQPGLLSQTFTSSTAAIAVGEKILNMLDAEEYFGPKGKIDGLHAYFNNKLKDLNSKYPEVISGPFGAGLMVAFKAFDGNAEKTTKFLHALFKNGLIAFTAGLNPMRIRFLIPVLCTENVHIDKAIEIIERTLVAFS